MMRRSWLLFPAVLASAAALVAAPQTEITPPPSLDSLVQGNRTLAVTLYRALAAADGNLFCSPFSISSALAMVYAGARGKTAGEMQAVLHFPSDPESLPAHFQRLTGAVTESARHPGLALRLANGLCLVSGEVSLEFKTLLRTHFEAELLAGNLDTINKWVRSKTGGAIHTILDQLDPQSACVLLNAIYFKGRWEHPFDPHRTQDALFTVAPGKTAPTRLMHRRGCYPFLETPDFQALLLPYAGRTISLAVLLPRKPDGLAAMEQQLTADTLAGWLEELDQAPARETDVFLPAFALETGYDLAPCLQALGMRAAFDRAGGADFRGMGCAKGTLFISQICHKAAVDVCEEGTEAAAATAVEMALTAAPEPPPVFRADHPFLFLIRDSGTGSLLFMGRLAQPAAR